MSEIVVTVKLPEGVEADGVEVTANLGNPMKQTHFGDPCIHCGVPQMEVAPGACPGDPAKAKVIGFASLGVRPDGVERFRYRLSTNELCEVYSHISNHAPYYHFGRSDDLIQPPPYDMRLRANPALAQVIADAPNHQPRPPRQRWVPHPSRRTR